MVRHMGDMYTNNCGIRLPRFWKKAFKAAYEDLTSYVMEVRDITIVEIANTFLHFFDLQLPSVTHSTIVTSSPSN